MRTHPHLYEISAWPWLEKLSRQENRRVTLADVPASAWDAIEKSGMDCVYLMGVWKRSAVGRLMGRTDPSLIAEYDRGLPGWEMRDVPGSPYCIQAYEPDDRMGGWKALDKTREELSDRGMSLILDFVPNHTGFDHEWVRTNPEYYVQGTLDNYRAEPILYHPIEDQDGTTVRFIACGRDPFFAPWRDVAQLNYFNPGTRGAMIGVLQTIAKHCDGVRCDMAMLVLNDIFSKTWAHLLADQTFPEGEFWSDAIAALPADFLWMAEVYWDMEWRLQQLGFNYTYDKRLYDRLESAAPHEIRAHLSGDGAYQSRMARFLENPDEPRSAKTFGRARLPGLATLLATLPGLRFFHQGQFEGKTLHLPMPLNAAADEAPDLELAKTYEKILAIAAQPIFHLGEWRLLDVGADSDGSHEQLIAYRWRRDGEYKLIVINLAGHAAQGRIPLADELAPSAQYNLFDELSDTAYLRERQDLLAQGLYVRLEAYGAHIFSIGAA